MTEQTYFILIIAIASLGFVVDRYLSYLNLKNWSDDIPKELSDFYDSDKFKKSRQYQLSNARFSVWSSTFSFLVLIVCLLTGFFGEIDEFSRELSNSNYGHSLIFFTVLLVGMDLLSTPFSAYATFKIEAKFGFNKTTVPTYILDKIKSYIMMFILGGGILYVMMAIFEEFQTDFWIFAWIVMGCFMLIMATFYTSFILPIFNKLEALEEGELKRAIQAYCDKIGYDLKHIYVMNGSKRSSKANAFFSGMGKRKTIVLYDTLIEQHTTEELVAVLAHEVGHYKLKHTQKGMISGLLQMGFMLFILSQFITDPELSKAMGAETASFHMGILAFTIIYSPISNLFGIYGNVLSRKHEFEADAFASKTYDSNSLSQALKKLSSKNLGNLHPHPWFVFVNYSHPPILERLEAIKN